MFCTTSLGAESLHDVVHVLHVLHDVVQAKGSESCLAGAKVPARPRAGAEGACATTCSRGRFFTTLCGCDSFCTIARTSLRFWTKILHERDTGGRFCTTLCIHDVRDDVVLHCRRECSAHRQAGESLCATPATVSCTMSGGRKGFRTTSSTRKVLHEVVQVEQVPHEVVRTRKVLHEVVQERRQGWKISQIRDRTKTNRDGGAKQARRNRGEGA